MALFFGVGRLQVSGVSVGRVHNVTVNINYDNAVMRGDEKVFPDNIQFFNGEIAGSWENGELTPSGLGDIMGGTGTFAAGSGTWALSATQWPKSGVQVIFSGVTDGVTCTITLKSVRVNSMALNFDRENYLMPQCNFICVGDATNDDLISIQM